MIFGKTAAPCDGGDGDGAPCDGGDGGSGAGTSCGQSAHGEGLVGPVPWKKTNFDFTTQIQKPVGIDSWRRCEDDHLKETRGKLEKLEKVRSQLE